MNTPFYFECPYCFGEAFGLMKMPKPLDTIRAEDVIHKDNPKPGDEVTCQECGAKIPLIRLTTSRIRTRPTAEELQREAIGILPGETIEEVIQRENGIDPKNPCDICHGTGTYYRQASIGESGINEDELVPCICTKKYEGEEE